MTDEGLKLPIIDLSSPDHNSSATSNRQACIEYGFFYLVNHGVEEELLAQVFDQSSKFFSLPLEDKLKLEGKENRGYTPLFAENLDPTASSKDMLPSWKTTMESYYKQVLIFFEKVGDLNNHAAFLRLLHYPAQLALCDEEVLGASLIQIMGRSRSWHPMVFQDFRDKSKQPRVWENVLHIDGAFIVNIGDLMERWTNCLFQSTLHRVTPPRRERYSVAFFLDPNAYCLVECLASCCNESLPPRFPPIRSGDYLKERGSVAHMPHKSDQLRYVP